MKQAAAAARQARLTRVLGSAWVPAQTPVPIASDSNDVWRIGAVVLRICWRGDRDRFAREAAVTAALPPGIPYPEIVDAGRNDELAWQVTRGRPKRGRAACSAGWPKATRPRSRRQACSPACGCTRSPTASARCSSTVPGGPPANWPLTSSCGDSAASSPVQAIFNGSSRQLRNGKPFRDGRRCATLAGGVLPMTTTVLGISTGAVKRLFHDEAAWRRSLLFTHPAWRRPR